MVSLKGNLCSLLILILVLWNQVSWARTITVAAKQTELPLKFDTGNPAPYGLPSTVVNIQGKTLSLIFDTGAAKTEITLSPYALKGIHVQFLHTETCFKSVDGKHCEQEFIIPEVQIGSFIIKNVRGQLMPRLWGNSDKSFLQTAASKNGVIGFALLSKFNVLLDYRHAKAVLVKPNYQPRQYDVTNWISIPFHEHLLTKQILNDKLITLGWDTGSVPSVIKATAAKNFQQYTCPQNTPYGKEQSCLRVITSSFTTLDSKPLPNTWLLVEKIPVYAPFDGLIGSNFYSENLTYFDFDHHKIYLKPIGELL